MYLEFDKQKIKNDLTTQIIDIVLIGINSHSVAINNFICLNEYEKLHLITPGDHVSMEPGFRVIKNMISRQILKYKSVNQLYLTPKVIYIGAKDGSFSTNNAF